MRGDRDHVLLPVKVGELFQLADLGGQFANLVVRDVELDQADKVSELGRQDRDGV